MQETETPPPVLLMFPRKERLLHLLELGEGELLPLIDKIPMPLMARSAVKSLLLPLFLPALRKRVLAASEEEIGSWCETGAGLALWILDGANPPDGLLP